MSSFRAALVIIFNSMTLSCPYRILGVFPHAAPSHVDVFLPIMSGLAEKGHDVTMLSYYRQKTLPPRYTELVLENPDEDLVGSVDLSQLGGRRVEKYVVGPWLGHLGQRSCESALNAAAAQALLRSNATFDAVVAEFFNSECFAAFAHKFQAPLIGLSSCTIMTWTNERFANPTHPAYIPVSFMDFSDHLSFFERLENSVVLIFNQLVYNLYSLRANDKIARKYFGDDLPPLKDIIFNASLFLVNAHFSLNLPRPLVPAVIDIGGVHIGRPKKLPPNIEKWINESAHGVIYFSLGSMIKGHTFPEEKRQEFLKAFGRLPQRVLWKWDNDSMPGKPDNVMIQKWMPQFDILCHPNVRGFISHGGLLGTTEAVHCGVPIIVMPQYGDQFTNAKALEANGGGVILNLREANEEKVYNALRAVLDPTFRRQARELSDRFKDRPLPPLETAIYWVEYVARHRGARHMRTAAVDMPFYKYLLLDVIAFLLLVFATISTIAFYAANFVFRKLFTRRPNKVKTN